MSPVYAAWSLRCVRVNAICARMSTFKLRGGERSVSRWLGRAVRVTARVSVCLSRSYTTAVWVPQQIIPPDRIPQSRPGAPR